MGPRGPGERHLQPGRILYAILTGQAPYGSRTPRRGPREGQALRVPRAQADQAGRAASSGGDLLEGDGEQAGGPLRDGARARGRREALAGR